MTSTALQTSAPKSMSGLKKLAIIGLVATGTALGGATAANAGSIQFGFGFHGPNGSFYVGPNVHHAPRVHHRHRYHRDTITIRQARRALRHQGFRGIRFVRENRRAYVFTARSHGRMFRVRVNKFNGYIMNVRRIHA